MPTPHKHAAVIKAWADGQEIQSRLMESNPWHDNPDPEFDPAWQYRVKPSNVVRFCPVFTMPAGSIVVGMGVTEHHHATRPIHPDKGPEETLRGVLRIEINPDTLELVSATMEAP